MQRHKKYLIVTIWISTIAFIGAGFVGWGQYSYGDKAGAVAKVGQLEISMGDLQNSYSNLYSQYSKMFQGNFDEEKAKKLGLQKAALDQLINQALILNLAKDYDFSVSDLELLKSLKTQKYFFKDGAFDKATYKSVIANSTVDIKTYEESLRKQLLLEKVMDVFKVKIGDEENSVFSLSQQIVDIIKYKILKLNDMKVEVSEEKLRAYWENTKQEFLSELSYKVEYIKQDNFSKNYTDEEIEQYFNKNKNHFKSNEGKLLSLELAKNDIIRELNAKIEKENALRKFIDYKKFKLSKDIPLETTLISQSNNPYTQELIEKLVDLNFKSPFMKPILINGNYYIFKLIKVNAPKVREYLDVKPEISQIYIEEKKREKLLKLAQGSVENFDGEVTKFVGINDASKFNKLDIITASELLLKIFKKHSKKDFLQLDNGDVVLYEILDQKLLKIDNKESNSNKEKHSIFDFGLIDSLKNKYKIQIFLKEV